MMIISFSRGLMPFFFFFSDLNLPDRFKKHEVNKQKYLICFHKQRQFFVGLSWHFTSSILAKTKSPSPSTGKGRLCAVPPLFFWKWNSKWVNQKEFCLHFQFPVQKHSNPVTGISVIRSQSFANALENTFTDLPCFFSPTRSSLKIADQLLLSVFAFEYALIISTVQILLQAPFMKYFHFPVNCWNKFIFWDSDGTGQLPESP